MNNDTAKTIDIVSLLHFICLALAGFLQLEQTIIFQSSKKKKKTSRSNLFIIIDEPIFSRMVVLHIKKGEESLFLFNSTVTASIDDVTREVNEIYNARLRVDRLCSGLIEHDFFIGNLFVLLNLSEFICLCHPIFATKFNLEFSVASPPSPYRFLFEYAS